MYSRVVAAGAHDAWLCTLISFLRVGSMPTDAWLGAPISVMYSGVVAAGAHDA